MAWKGHRLFFIRDFFVFYPRLFFLSATFFFIRNFFFLRDFFFYLRLFLFYPRLFFLIRAFSSAVFFLIRGFFFAMCVKTAGSHTLKSRPAGNMAAAAMAGEDREEKEQGSIRKVNILSYFWYQFTGKKVSKHLMSNQLERYTQYI